MKMNAPTLAASRAALPPEGAAEPWGGPAVRRRTLLTLSGAALLGGCGFQLRQAPNFVFSSAVINAPESSPLAQELRRQLAADGKVQVLATATVATAAGGAASSPASGTTPAGQIIFDLLQEQREKVVVGMNAAGQVTAFQLRSRVRFRVRNARGVDLIPDTELEQHRDITFSETAVLAKQAEESLMYRDMQSDTVQQLMRRLAALRTLA
jgi:LPS-assembly lipoprotein